MRQLDKAIAPKLEQLHMQRKQTVLESRAQASLQLAFRASHCLRFYEADNFGVGVYEITDKKQRDNQLMIVFMELLEYASPHLYFDNKCNNHWYRQNLPERIRKAQLAYCEGYFSDKFNLYAPQDYAIDSLVVGAPDVLDAIDQLNLGGDIEVVGNQLYMIFLDDIQLSKMLSQIVANGHELAKEFNDNLSRYKDDRATDQQVINYEGRRIIRH